MALFVFPRHSSRLNGINSLLYSVNQHLIKRFESSHRELKTSVKPVAAKPFSKDSIAELIQKHKILSKDEWLDIRENFTQNISESIDRDVDSQIIQICSDNCNPIQNALSYRDSIEQENLRWNTASSVGLLQMYLQHRLQLTSADLQNLEEICNQIAGQGANCSISTAVNSLVIGLSLTKKWKEAFELIEDNLHRCPFEMRSGISAIIQRAFQEEERDLGLDLLRKYHQHTSLFMIDPDIFQSYWKFCQKNANDLKKNIDIMLQLIQNERMIISKQTISALNETLKEINETLDYTTFNQNGKCEKCKGTLEKSNLSLADYEKLRSVFHDRVLFKEHSGDYGTDIKNHDWFKKWLLRTGSFDCVIDFTNLNRWYPNGSEDDIKDPVETQRKIISVIKDLRKYHQSILLVGTFKMGKYSLIQDIEKLAEVYFAESRYGPCDDSYAPYAALCQGPSVRFISAENLDHLSYHMGPEMMALFQQWQHIHQYNLETDKPDYQKALSFKRGHRPFTQKNGHSWHVSFVDSNSSNAIEIRNAAVSWACYNPSNSATS